MATKAKRQTKEEISAWAKVSNKYYDAKYEAKQADDKAKSLSGERGRANHGIGYYSNPEMEASRKKRLAMADSEHESANVRAAQAENEMKNFGKRPPTSKKWTEEGK